MLCFRCSAPIPDASRFCMSCGAEVSGETETSQSLDEAGVKRLERLLRHEAGRDYRIELEIGRGGMGVVYSAHEIHLGRKVAIKVLPPSLTFGEGAIERFRREARTAASLEHPNIIPIYRVSSGGELLWYVMKFIEGHTLDERSKAGESFALERTHTILRQIAGALHYAHGRGVVHRDIKPANIILDANGHVTITDFGIAKELQAGSLTASGLLLGTPSYMSPEQYLGGAITGATDQYSLGVLAFQLLTGRLPFEAATAYELFGKHCTVAPPRVDSFRPEVSQAVNAAVDRALAKESEDRFPTVMDFVAALQPTDTAAVTVDYTTPTPTAGPRSDARRGRKGLAWIGAALVLSAGAIGVSQWRGPGGGSTPVGPMPTVDTGEASSRVAAEAPSDTLAARSEEPATSSAGPPAAQPTASPENQGAVLVIQTDGPWASIFVDGALQRRGPSYRGTLPPGTHTVRLERPGYGTVDTTVTMQGGDTLTIRVPMRRVN